MRTRLLKILRRRIGRQYFIDMWASKRHLKFYVFKEGHEGYIFSSNFFSEAKRQVDICIDKDIRAYIDDKNNYGFYGPLRLQCRTLSNRYQHLYYVRANRHKVYRSVSRLRYEFFRGNHPGLAIVEKVDGPLFFHWYG